MQQSFSGLGVPARIVRTLAERDITTPFPIQARVLGDALAGRDILAKAPTGSGKTLAFAIPIVEALDPRARRPAALVLVPTRELAAQVSDEIRAIAPPDIRVATVYGGVPLHAQAKRALEAHLALLRRTVRPIIELALPAGCEHGDFFPPCAYQIDLSQIPHNEVFGPILHVIRYRREALDAVLDAIGGTGFGLTLGIHSRIARFADDVRHRLKVGNTYVNRNMIGAVVGVQPFGGESLSGTGPKAGGPRYLQRFAVERTLTINTAAAGGNAGLLAEIG